MCTPTEVPQFCVFGRHSCSLLSTTHVFISNDEINKFLVSASLPCVCSCFTSDTIVSVCWTSFPFDSALPIFFSFSNEWRMKILKLIPFFFVHRVFFSCLSSSMITIEPLHTCYEVHLPWRHIIESSSPPQTHTCIMVVCFFEEVSKEVFPHLYRTCRAQARRKRYKLFSVDRFLVFLRSFSHILSPSVVHVPLSSTTRAG